MPHIKVTSEMLDAAAAQVSGKANELASEIQALQSSVEGQLGTDWEGQAAGKFEELWKSATKSAHDAADSLGSIGQALKNAAQTYRDAEEGVLKSFSG